ncbi:hypothetical protein CHS0354_010267 [Potamilus streckersoni]|uniref:Uncharacterized protein n=1 Tax=Potamilus streckersoni TaxID=2493646 RepID=A0AAE0W2P8_9BIVA|nr:hypothetical protein CHS0354_010267 [Potamilus streckersoni]
MPVGGNPSQAAMYQNSTGVRQTASSYPQRMSSTAYQNSMPNTQQGLFQLPQQNTTNYTPHAHTHIYNNPPAVFYNAAQQNRPPSASGMSGPGQLPAKKKERTVMQIIDPNSGKDIMQDLQPTRSTPPSSGTLGSHGSQENTKSEVSTSITENKDQDKNSTKAKTSHKMFATTGLQSSHMETEDSWLRSSSEEDELKSKNKAQDSSFTAKIDKNKKQNSAHMFKRKKDSKKRYDRKFLLKLQNSPQSMIKPADLPDIPEIMIEKSINNHQGKDALCRGINLEMQKNTSLHPVDGSRKSPRVDEEQKKKPSKSEDSIVRAERENQKQKTTKAEAHDKKVGTVDKPSTHVGGEKNRSNSSLEEHVTKLDNQAKVASRTKKTKKNKKQKAVLRSKKVECSPIIPDSKKKYDRKFLLKLQNAPQSMIKPANLPDIPEIIIEKPNFQIFPQDFTNIGNIADFTTRYVWTDKNQLTRKGGTGQLDWFMASIKNGSRSLEVERSYLPINRFSAVSKAHKTDDKDSHGDRWRGIGRLGLQDIRASEGSQRDKSTKAAILAEKSQDDGSHRGGQQGRFGRPGLQVNHPSQELQTEIDIAAAKTIVVQRLSEVESGQHESEWNKMVEKPSTLVQELTDDQMLSKTHAIMDEYLHIQDVKPQYSHQDNGGSGQNIKQENNEILSTQKDTNLNHVKDGAKKSTQDDAEGDEVEVEEDQNNETNYTSQPSIQPPNNSSQPSIQPPNYPSQPNIQPPNYPSQPSIQPPNNPSQPSIQPTSYTSQPSIQPPNNPSQPSIQPPSYPSQPSMQPGSSYSVVYPQPSQGMYISPQHMITPQQMSMPQVHYSSTGTQVRMPLSGYPNHLNMQPINYLMGQPLHVSAAPQQRTTSPPQQMIMAQHQQMTIPQHQQMTIPQHQQMTIPQHQQMAAQQYQNMTTPQQAQYNSVGTQVKMPMNKCLPSNDDNNRPGDQINGKEVQEEQNCILMLPGLLPDKSQEENTSIEGPDEQLVQSHLSSDNGQRVIQSQEPSGSRKSSVKSPEWDLMQLEKEKLKLEIEFIKVKYKKIIEETEVLKLQKELIKLQINNFS